MCPLTFSYHDYQDGLSRGLYSPPDYLLLFNHVDPVSYNILSLQHPNTDNDIYTAMSKVQERTTKDYYAQIRAVQLRTLAYAASAFPAYKFILPEVIKEDWLASVDWSKYHRDHVVHQPLTAYVVMKLLQKNTNSEELTWPAKKHNLVDICVEHIVESEDMAWLKEYLVMCGEDRNSDWFKGGRIGRLLWKALFLDAAYLASIFHDLGYPWQYYTMLGKRLDHSTWPSMKNGHSGSGIVSDFSDRLLYIAMNGYQHYNPSAPVTWPGKLEEQTEEAMSLTHGLPGALAFLYLNDLIRLFPDNRPVAYCQLCIEWAAVAIMMHDNIKIYQGANSKNKSPQRPYLRVRAGQDPLSALLTLADTLQDFNRPAAEFASNQTTVNMGYQHSCLESSISIDGDSATIHFKMFDHPSLAMKRKSLRDERRALFDKQYGYLDLSGWGIRRTLMTASL